MIKAVMWQDAQGAYTGYRLSGHSGYAEAGSDIVCAAASALAINCLNSLEAVCGIAPIAEGGEDGYLKVLLPADVTQSQQHDAQVLLRALRQGLSDLHTEYPQYMRIPDIERRELP